MENKIDQPICDINDSTAHSSKSTILKCFIVSGSSALNDTPRSNFLNLKRIASSNLQDLINSNSKPGAYSVIFSYKD